MVLAREEAERLVASVPFWYHSIDLGPTATKGVRSAPSLAREVTRLRLPDLGGKSVLDIGAWDGYFSFACERLGARRVVALDHYVWSLDIGPFIADWPNGSARLVAEESVHWRPDELPGKHAYDTAHRVLDSRVETVVDDFMAADLGSLGTFDVVLYLGVLYHMRNPLEALTRLASVTDGMAIIETEAIVLPFTRKTPLCEFFETDELNSDGTNWWAPNQAALEGMCRAAGFRRVETIVGPSMSRWAAHAMLSRIRSPLSRTKAPNRCAMYRYRAVVHAWK
jgi:tRNA (mo5U34)-methyltransferase